MSTQKSAAELKAQGAVEAAQNANSTVTSQDAQNKVVEEAKKAGAAAFQFDPDATPEQKAAQARSVSENTLKIKLPCKTESGKYS
jgi:hypothetical protein